MARHGRGAAAGVCTAWLERRQPWSSVWRRSAGRWQPAALTQGLAVPLLLLPPLLWMPPQPASLTRLAHPRLAPTPVLSPPAGERAVHQQADPRAHRARDPQPLPRGVPAPLQGERRGAARGQGAGRRAARGWGRTIGAGAQCARREGGGGQARPPACGRAARSRVGPRSAAQQWPHASLAAASVAPSSRGPQKLCSSGQQSSLARCRCRAAIVQVEGKPLPVLKRQPKGPRTEGFMLENVKMETITGEDEGAHAWPGLAGLGWVGLVAAGCSRAGCSHVSTGGRPA